MRFSINCLFLIDICFAVNEQHVLDIPKFNYSSRYRNLLLKPLPWYKDENCYLKKSENSQPVCEQPDEYSVCFGANITYPYVPLSIAPNNNEISSHLALLLDYSGFPDCFQSLRNLLCMTQFAPCHSSKVKLVSKGLCLEAKSKCDFLIKNTKLWPFDLENCSNTNIFSNNCPTSLNSNDYKFNFRQFYDARKCIPPLVPSKYESGWFLVPHCALNCTNPLLTDTEHQSLESFIRWLFVLIFPLTIFTILTLILDIYRREKSKKLTRKCPETILLRILVWNLFFHILISSCFILSTNSSVRRSLICREDGSLKKFEIGVEQNYLCVIQFVLLYYCIIGLSISFAGFSLLICMLNVKNRQKMDQIFEKETFLWVHIVWALPILLVAYPLSTKQVEADGISGLCFLGHSNPQIATYLVYLPLFIFSIFSILCVLFAFIYRKSNQNGECFYEIGHLLSPLKLFLFFTIHFLALSIAFLVHWTLTPVSADLVKSSIAKFIDCSVKSTFPYPDQKPAFYPKEECKLNDQIHTPFIHLHIFLYFSVQLTVNFCALIGTKIVNVWFLLFSKICPNGCSIFYDNIKNEEQLQLAPMVASQPTSDSEILTDSKNDENCKTQNNASADKHQKLGDFQKRLNRRYSSFSQRRSASSSVPSSLRSTSLLSIHNRGETPAIQQHQETINHQNPLMRYPYPIYPTWAGNNIQTPLYFLPPMTPTARGLSPQQFFPAPPPQYFMQYFWPPTAIQASSGAQPSSSDHQNVEGDEKEVDLVEQQQDSDADSCDSAEEALIDKQFGISKSEDSLP